MGDVEVEGLHVKETISKKIWSRDYTGARALLEESQRNSTSLEHALEMRIVCEILCSTEVELPNCGIDWYGVLQLSPLAEATVIEAQYQKLVSLLRPIKNDLPGTMLALNFVEDAFSVLSDPVKRAAFDAKRNSIGSSLYDLNSEVRCSGGLKSGNETMKERGVAGCSDAPGASRSKRTAYDACGGNGNLGSRAEDCADDKQRKKICAEEASWVTAKVRSEDGNGLHKNLEEAIRPSSPHLVARKRCHPDFYDFENNRKADLFTTGQLWVVYDQENMPRRYARLDKVISVSDKCWLYVAWFNPCPQSLQEKRWCDAGLPVSCGLFALDSSKITVVNPMMFSHLLSSGTTKQSIEVYPKKGDVWAVYRDWNMEWYSNPGIRHKCGFETVEILTDCSQDTGVKVASLVKVDRYKNIFQRYSKRGNELPFHIPVNKLFMFSHQVPAFRFVGGEIDGIANGMLELDPLAVPDDLGYNFSCTTVAFADAPPRSSSCSDESSFTQHSMNTLDSGDLNFRIQNHKPKWSPKDFAIEQIWAIYDGRDAMPRLYVKVTDVISPTKVRVTYLEPHPVRDEEIQWVEESLPMACGIFRAGRATDDLEISMFSHLVKCDRSMKKFFYRIYPRKGEIWAMYKNWNSNWKNSDLVRCQCRVVEILSDFSEEAGINICSLAEVKGCLTFFQKQLYEGFQLTRQLSGLEMLSFSHRIPAFTVVGIRDRNIPKGSWHLEPDALPLKFIN